MYIDPTARQTDWGFDFGGLKSRIQHTTEGPPKSNVIWIEEVFRPR